MILRLLLFIFGIAFNLQVWGYAYDDGSNPSNYKIIDLELQNQRYDDPPNLCYNDRKCIDGYLHKKIQGGSFFAFEVGLVAAKGLAGVPGRVQSRINLQSDGLTHTLSRHLNPASSGSQFSLSKDGLSALLQSKQVVNSPITQVLDSGNFLRVVNVGKNIGFDKFSGNRATSTLSVKTDKFGNLVTATPGVIK